jgi:hypothetical protein
VGRSGESLSVPVFPGICVTVEAVSGGPTTDLRFHYEAGEGWNLNSHLVDC